MNTIPIDTMYLKGEEILLPFDATLFNQLYKMGPSDERSEWVREFLKLNNITVRETCFLKVVAENGKVKKISVINTTYKPDVYIG